jgi:hypothetical protein
MNQPNPKPTFKANRSFEASPQTDLSKVIQAEGAKTRKTIWFATITLALILISAPLLLAGASALLIALPIGILAAVIGGCIGRFINRRRQRKIFSEIHERNNENIIPLNQD